MWYKLLLARLERSPKVSKGSWKSRKLLYESRPSKLQYCCDQPEYWEDSWTPEETCCLSDPSERPPDNFGVKKSQGIKSKDLEVFTPLVIGGFHRNLGWQQILSSFLEKSRWLWLHHTLTAPLGRTKTPTNEATFWPWLAIRILNSLWPGKRNSQLTCNTPLWHLLG